MGCACLSVGMWIKVRYLSVHVGQCTCLTNQEIDWHFIDLLYLMVSNQVVTWFTLGLEYELAYTPLKWGDFKISCIEDLVWH